MTDLFKKAALFNAELISIGAEKVKEVADDFVRKGILDDQEARRFVLDVREKLMAKEQELGEKVMQFTQQVSKLGQGVLSNGFFADALRPVTGGSKNVEPSESRINELERQLDDLRARKESLKSRNGSPLKKDSNKDELTV